MNTNYHKTFDDMEPVISNEGKEKIIQTGSVKPVSVQGRMLYEKIQEQRELEALNEY